MNELAWTLALDRSPAIERILRHVIVLLVPCENPDGLQQIVEWYRGNRGTPYEDSPPPELYHPYAGHDNNRDAYMLTQAETTHLARIMYRDWLPEVYLDLHQMGPARARIFLPPYRSPSNPNIDPLLWSEVNVLGQTMAAHAAGVGPDGRAVGRDLHRLLAGRQQHGALVAQHRRPAVRGRRRAAGRADRSGASPIQPRAASPRRRNGARPIPERC